MLIIFEGPDRVGKTTQIQYLKNYLASYNKLVHYFHYSSIKGVDNIKEYSYNLYKSMFKISNENKDIFIADRFHFGELVYGKLYRHYDSEVLDLEKPYKNDIILILLIDDVENLIKRDDGNSFSTKYDLKQQEIELFINAFNKSIIKNKLLINIKYKNIEEVRLLIREFIDKCIFNGGYNE